MICPKCKSDNTRIELVRGSDLVALVIFSFATPISILIVLLLTGTLYTTAIFYVLVYNREAFIFIINLLGVVVALLLISLNIYIAYRIYLRKEYILCQSCGQSTIVSKNNPVLQRVLPKQQVQKQKTISKK